MPEKTVQDLGVKALSEKYQCQAAPKAVDSRRFIANFKGGIMKKLFFLSVFFVVAIVFSLAYAQEDKKSKKDNIETPLNVINFVESALKNPVTRISEIISFINDWKAGKIKVVERKDLETLSFDCPEGCWPHIYCCGPSDNICSQICTRCDCYQMISPTVTDPQRQPPPMSTNVDAIERISSTECSLCEHKSNWCAKIWDLCCPPGQKCGCVKHCN